MGDDAGLPDRVAGFLTRESERGRRKREKKSQKKLVLDERKRRLNSFRPPAPESSALGDVRSEPSEAAAG